jgi:cellulose biosynthesis protein BcsQ
MTRTVAFVGATGGAGTTRLTVESGATLARAGLDVAVIDAAFTTQGLASYVDGPIETDVTALVTDDRELGDALYDHAADLPGRLALCPARAPFERLARAQTAGATKEFERQLAAASLSVDVVLVDTPPVGGNHAIAAVNTADHVAVVTPDSPRGADALALTRERFDDLGVPIHGVVTNWANDHLSEVTVRIPESDVTDPRGCPACIPPDETFAPAIASGLESLLDTDFDLDFPESGRLDGIL